MKTLTDLIIDDRISDDIIEVTEEYYIENGGNIVNEKLNNKYIKDVAKALNKNRDKYSWRAFTNLIGRSGYQWDKVDDTYSKYYNAGDKEGINKAKELIDAGWGGNGIIIVLDSDDEPHRYMFKGQYISVDSGMQPREYRRETPHGYKDLTVPKKAKISELKANNFVIIDLSELDTVEIRKNRSIQQQGIVKMDKWSLDRMARENLQRYKTEAAKIRQARVHGQDDKYSKLVKDTVDKVYDLTIKITKDPINFADKMYSIETLQHMIYGERHYVGYKRGQSEYRGADGLLSYFSVYVKYKISLASGKGSYDAKSDERAMEAVKQKIEKQVKSINDYIEHYFKDI